MSLGERLNDFFESKGIEYVYGVPGEGVLEILDAFRDGPIHFVATRQLWAAGYAALGEAWAARRPAICVYGAGTYSAELNRSVLDARRNAIPIVFVGPSDGSSDPQDRSSNPHAPLHAAKARITMSSLDALPGSLPQAFELAQGEPPGPVSVEFGLPSAKGDAETSAAFEMTAAGGGPAEPSGLDLQALARQLTASERPVILAGSRVSWDEAGDALIRFARTLDIPIAPTLGALGVMRPEDPLLRPVCGLQERDDQLAGVREADLVLAVGVRGGDVPDGWLRTTSGRSVVRIPPRQLANLLDDLQRMDAVQKAVAERKCAPRQTADVTRCHSELSAMRDRFGDTKSFPPNPVQVLDAVHRVLDEDDAILVDAGLTRLWAGRFLEPSLPHSVCILPSAVSPGFALPASLGVRLVHSKGRVLALCGDASFLAACPEIETHRRMGSHVVTLVLRDNRLGWIGHQQERAFERSPFVSFRLPNLIRLSKVLGGTGGRLERGDRLETLLRECFAAQGVAVLDCPVDTRGTEVVVEAWGRPIGII